ncbi:MAG: response regulator [Spirochaetes bacterium]|nr:response regulator [Spirochaetota bacterium]
MKKEGDDCAIAIVDLNRPVMDGITFVGEFRKADKFTPVLILTIGSEENKIKSGKEAGASGWLVKPFQSDQFVTVVESLV